MIQDMHNDTSDTRDGYRWDDYRQEDAIHAISAGFRRKVQRSIDIAADWLAQCDKPYIGVSGGKDSVAVVGVVVAASELSGIPMPPLFWHNSGVEWPGSKMVIDRLLSEGWADDLVIATTDADIAELKRRQEAGEISAKQKDQIALFDPVAQTIAKHGFTGAALGLRKEESRARMLDGCVHGPIFQKKDGLLRCTPIQDWSWRDVFAFIASEKLPLHPIYSAPLYGLENRGRIRLSWWLSTDHWRHGEVAWVKRNYPPVYAEIERLIPDVTRLT